MASLLKNMEKLRKTYDEQYIDIPKEVFEHENTGSSIGSGARKKLDTLFHKPGKLNPKDISALIKNQNLDVLEVLIASPKMAEISKEQKLDILGYENDFARGHNVTRGKKADDFFTDVVRDLDTALDDIHNTGTDKQLQRTLKYSNASDVGPAIMDMIGNDKLGGLSDETYRATLEKMDHGHRREAIRTNLSPERTHDLISSTSKGYSRHESAEPLQKLLLQDGKHEHLAYDIANSRGVSPDVINQSLDSGHDALISTALEHLKSPVSFQMYLDKHADSGPENYKRVIQNIDEIGDAEYNKMTEDIVSLAVGNPEYLKAMNRGAGYSSNIANNLSSESGLHQALAETLPPEYKTIGGQLAEATSDPEVLNTIINKQKVPVYKSALSNPAADVDMIDSFFETLLSSDHTQSDHLSPFILNPKSSTRVINHIFDNNQKDLSEGGYSNRNANQLLLSHPGLSADRINQKIDTTDSDSELMALASNTNLDATAMDKFVKHKNKDLRQYFYSNKNLPPEILAKGLKDRAPSIKKHTLDNPGVTPELLEGVIFAPSKAKTEKAAAFESEMKDLALQHPNLSSNQIDRAFAAPDLSGTQLDNLLVHPNAPKDLIDRAMNEKPSIKLMNNVLDTAEKNGQSLPEEQLSKFVDRFRDLAPPQEDHGAWGGRSEARYFIDNIMTTSDSGVQRKMIESTLDNPRVTERMINFHNEELKAFPDLAAAAATNEVAKGIGPSLFDRMVGELDLGDNKEFIQNSLNSGKVGNAYRSDHAGDDLYHQEVQKMGNYEDLQELNKWANNSNKVDSTYNRFKELQADMDPEDRQWIPRELVRDSNISPETLADIHNKVMNDEFGLEAHDATANDNIQFGIIDNKHATEDMIRDIHRTAQNDRVKKRAGSKFSLFSPDEYNSSLENAHSVDIHPATEKLKHLKGLVQEQGGSIHKSKLQELKHGGAPGQVLDHKGEVTEGGIEKFISNLPKTKYNVSYSTWDGMQRHDDSVDQKVVQLNLTNDHVKAMKEADVFGTFREMHEDSKYSGHPVENHSLGWARVDDSKPDHWHIDEVQSDFGQNTINQISQSQKDGDLDDETANKKISDLKTIMNIVKGPFKSVNHAIIGATHQVARDNNIKSTSMDLVHDQAEQSSMDTSRSLPGHMKQTYDQIPKQMNYEPKSKDEAMPGHESEETEVNYRKLTKSLTWVKFLLAHLDQEKK